ncbi:MAG TPA: carboxypeptidase regulatory-like domain-containing protein [Candidatus Aminicenantes bacterium]|nr:carboxypeptidase regulatory-like domain-containing protein [Candidatus Aminicenantes bacterium]HRY65676.1 carboxypeptidase regulatory-like domain-containing protein [Candidatus Aminicenantes bacterium]HRZ72436.1 carboxypeptidase regulatory-like domain-containing protein [Candidatus Aminicenantes bacterium]
MKSLKAVTAVLLFFSLALLATAQISSRETGSIRGIVTDKDKAPIPGVSITLTSPALMGKATDVTRQDGAFRFVLLPPGEYTLVAELKGFQTIRQEKIDVRLGLTVTLNFALPDTRLEEEVTVVGAAPAVDVKASKTEIIMKADLLQNLPIGRNLASIIALTPGTVDSTNVKGSTAGGNTYQIDGLNANDPCQQQLNIPIEFNLMEEVEIMTGGMPAEVGTTSGGFINVITKSGGNRFSGVVQGFYTDKHMTRSVLPLDQLSALGLAKPNAPVYDWQGILGLGGPILKDRLWFYASARYARNKYGTAFVPFTDPYGTFYDTYDQKNWNWATFLKLTFQLSKSIRFALMGNVQKAFDNAGANGGLGWNIPFEVSQKDDPWANYALTGAMNWLIDKNTILELRGGYTNVDATILLTRPELTDTYYNYDYYTGEYFGTGYRGVNEWTGRPSWQASAHVIRFLDNVLGGDHEAKAGIEIQGGADSWAIWKNQPVEMYWYDGSPYYYDQVYGTNYWGDSFIGVNMYTPEKKGYMAQGNFLRVGGYIQDSFTIKKRLTINFGARYDNVRGWLPDIHHDQTGGIAFALGETYIAPYLDGFNPYAEFDMEGVKNIIKWDIITPRIGLTYDLFGNGKTALKLHYGMYSDNIWVSIFERIHPLRWNTYYFAWWDDNGDRLPSAPGEGGDQYEMYWSWGNPGGMLRENWITGVAPGIKSPYDNQFSAGIDHELFKSFRVGLSYIYKYKKNIIDDVLYDLDTGRYWYNPATSPGDGYWVPFTTTVPAVGTTFPATTVTMYFQSNDSPGNWIERVANVPEAFRKYSGVELTFEKRRANGWQLGGSLNLSKTWGNIQGGYGDIHATTSVGDNANWFVNSGGRTSEDRPVVIKLFGSFDIPLGILASFNYQYASGTPWARTVTVVPPEDWAAANNVIVSGGEQTVSLEINGARRYYGWQNLDIRLEKSFTLKHYGTIAFFADVFNVLGNHYYNLYQDPAGTWQPTDNNVSTGTYTISGTYKKIYSISQLTRRIRLSFRYSF